MTTASKDVYSKRPISPSKQLIVLRRLWKQCTRFTTTTKLRGDDKKSRTTESTVFKKLSTKEVEGVKAIIWPQMRTYSGECLKVLGTMDTQVTYNFQSMMLPLLVVEGKGSSLLRQNWVEKVRLNWPQICNLATIQQTVGDITKEFPKFSVINSDVSKNLKQKSLSTLMRSHDSSSPALFLQAPLCSVSFEVNLELQRLEDLGIITLVSCADWTASVVPVLKANGSVRLCGDYKVTINRVIQKDVYPLPRIEDLLAALGGV